MDIKTALEKLYSFHQFKIKLGLENIVKLLDHLGNPQENFPSIHIAGSNGKGSTASFIASILMEEGYKTGLYTSPHFVRFNERVRINGSEIPDDYIAEFMTDMDQYIEKHSPTFFELTTAIAFKYFHESKIDYAVIETGLGGLLDATNVINSIASVITSVSLEHTNALGKTIKEIAEKKAGIIKKGKPVFVGDINEEATEVIKLKADTLNCPIYLLKESAILAKDHAIIPNAKKDFKIYQTPLKGIYQIKNAALASYMLGETTLIKSNKSLSLGIKNVIKNSGIQGRYEVYSEKPKIIFDAAHNEEGVEAFLKEFEKEYKNYENRVIIYGAMNDKNLNLILSNMKKYFDKVLFTSINYERAFKIEELVVTAKNLDLNYEVLEDHYDFIQKFISLQSADCLVILGSIYLLGEIKEKLATRKKNLTL